MSKQSRLWILVAIAFPILFSSILAGQNCDATLLTGSEKGYYYKLGMAIRQVASSEKDPALNLNLCVKTTDHNLDNVTELQSRRTDFAIVQSDVAHDAWYRHPPRFHDHHNGHQAWIVMPLYMEAVHILIRPHLEISRLEDLKGKTVGVYLANSGTEYTANHILAAVGLQPDGPGKNFTAVSTADPVFCNSVHRLIDGHLDALFRVTVIPSVDIQDAMTRKSIVEKNGGDECLDGRELRLLSLDHGLAERLVGGGSYIETLIPKSAYKQTESTLTVGVQSLLLASDQVSDEKVQKLASLFRNRHSEIERTLANIILQEHPGHDHSAPKWPLLAKSSMLSLSLLDVAMPDSMTDFVHHSSKPYLYHWWRDAWKPEFAIMVMLAIMVALVYRNRERLGHVIEKNPNLTFAIATTLLIWFVAACVLYCYGGVDEHFNSFPRSLISTFLYLANFPGYSLLNQDANSFAEEMKWLSLIILGGFASPLLKQGLDSLLNKMCRSLQGENCGSERTRRLATQAAPLNKEPDLQNTRVINDERLALGAD